MSRYTISDEARCDALTRLLTLNHERYAEEVAKGLHKKKIAAAAKKNKKPEPQGPTFFDGEEDE